MRYHMENNTQCVYIHFTSLNCIANNCSFKLNPTSLHVNDTSNANLLRHAPVINIVLMQTHTTLIGTAECSVHTCCFRLTVLYSRG